MDSSVVFLVSSFDFDGKLYRKGLTHSDQSWPGKMSRNLRYTGLQVWWNKVNLTFRNRGSLFLSSAFARRSRLFMIAWYCLGFTNIGTSLVPKSKGSITRPYEHQNLIHLLELRIAKIPTTLVKTMAIFLSHYSQSSSCKYILKSNLNIWKFFYHSPTVEVRELIRLHNMDLHKEILHISAFAWEENQRYSKKIHT